MRYQEEFRAVIEAAASNPKVSTAVSLTTASMGTAWFVDFLGGFLSTMAILTGVIATVFLIRVHLITYKQRELEVRILRKQAHDLGIDLENP